MNKLLLKLRNFSKQVKDYYPTYLAAHSKRGTKLAHLAGNIITLGYIAFVLRLSAENLWCLFMLPYAPVIIYFFAWPSHFFIEKNKPATFTVSPFITKACDWIMVKDIIIGKVKL